MNVLDTIVAHKREEIAAGRRARPVSAFSASRPPRDFLGALRGPGLSVIAEIKRRSPSKGAIRENLDPAVMARMYLEAGAAAISCLTDERFFGAQPDDLLRTAEATALPVLRKEFIVDPYQIHEARHLGADAVLLIVRILGELQLSELLSVCRNLHLAALVETHSASEIETALRAGANIIGINNRDLDTLRVSLATSLELRDRIPPDCIAVAESGISRREDMVALERAGFDAVLLGEALLTADNPGVRLRELTGVDA
jgi:indole-3-glycerol phosphate synthase